jgi:hypothetical protein
MAILLQHTQDAAVCEQGQTGESDDPRALGFVTVEPAICDFNKDAQAEADEHCCVPSGSQALPPGATSDRQVRDSVARCVSQHVERICEQRRGTGNAPADQPNAKHRRVDN